MADFAEVDREAVVARLIRGTIRTSVLRGIGVCLNRRSWRYRPNTTRTNKNADIATADPPRVSTLLKAIPQQTFSAHYESFRCGPYIIKRIASDESQSVTSCGVQHMNVPWLDDICGNHAVLIRSAKSK
jgi:hypothetical protein